MTYKHIVIDVAWTLLELNQVFDKIEEVLSAHSYEIPKKELLKTHRLLSEAIEFPDRTSKEFYLSFNNLFLHSVGVHLDLSEEIYESCKNLHWEVPRDSVELCQTKYPISVLSNWNSNLPSFLNTIIPDLKSLNVWSSEIEDVRKPSPHFFKLPVNTLNCQPQEILYIGDSIKLDYIPATQVGMTAILLDRHNIYPYFRGNKISSLTEIENYKVDTI